MNKKQVIAWAREAGCVDPMVFFGAYERFAALVAAAERKRACRIVTGLCISDNNAHEINTKIRERPANAHDKVYSEVDLANAYQKGWDDAMLRRSIGPRGQA
jgi:hypothetical protein